MFNYLPKPYWWKRIFRLENLRDFGDQQNGFVHYYLSEWHHISYFK